MSLPLKVKDLKKALEGVDDELEVFIRHQHICGNITNAGECNKDIYGFFGKSIDCIIIEPCDWEDEDSCNITTKEVTKMDKHWCMCTKLKQVARDGYSTCSICGVEDAYGKSKDRPIDKQKQLGDITTEEVTK